MKKGVLLIAHNTSSCDYYKMAVYTAKRVNKFLDLPVSIITDQDSITTDTYTFDNQYILDADNTNYRKKNTVWANKGRYRVYDCTPYEETLVLDTDYLINSDLLLNAFDIDSDFVCHKNIKYLLEHDRQEYLHHSTVSTLWATVFKFKKTTRVKNFFELVKMVQENYEHYANIYKFLPYMYRNDYAFKIAHKIVDGHLNDIQDYFWWNLWHIGPQVKVVRESDTSYVIMGKNLNNGKTDYLKLSDVDFHVLHKQNFMDLME